MNISSNVTLNLPFSSLFLLLLLFDSRSALGSRRESIAGPPSTDPRGSIHNLQLDIMDDIVQARKARMKLWNTSSEKVCEVHRLDENEKSTSSPTRYTNRRYSEFISAPLPTIQSYRRASEMPSLVSPSIPSSVASFGRKLKAGIVCTNTDLIGLLSTLTSSATEINEYEEIPTPTTKLITAESLTATNTPLARTPTTTSTTPCSGAIPKTPTTSSQRRSIAPVTPVLKTPSIEFETPERRHSSCNIRSSRSNSFDVSVLNNAKQFIASADEKTAMLSGWFTKRHQPMASKKSTKSNNPAVSFSRDVYEKFTSSATGSSSSKDSSAMKPSSSSTASSSTSKGTNKLKWDHKSPVVDAHVIGSAIEGFLRRSSATSTTSSKVGSGGGGSSSSGGGATPKETSRLKKSDKSGSSNGGGSSSKSGGSLWFGKGDEDDSKDTCDSSLCSTLKDLFVK